MHRTRTWEMVPAELRVRNRTLPFNAADGATLSLDFTELSALDSRFTFSRTSQATYINSSGFVAFADNNLVVNSTFGSSATPQGWSGSTGVNLTTPAVGVRRAVTTTAAQNFIGSSNLATSTGLTYSSSVYINEVSGQHYANTISITASPTNVTYYRNGVAVGQFETAQPGLITMTWTASTAFGHGLRVGVGATGANVASAVCEFTAPQTSRGTNTQPTYIANESTTSAYYAPRFDYSPITRAPRGLLIEGSSTNLLLYSLLAFTGSNPPTGWTSPFTGGPGSATTSTYGTLDGANAWTQTAAGNRPMLSSTAIALTNGTTYTASMYLEAVSGTLTYQDVLLLNASTATLGTPTYRRNGATVLAGDTAQIGRIEVTVACTGSGNVNLRCGPGANANCTGSATFSRPQVEIGFQASSYITTSASTVARSRDEMTMSNISALNFNQSGGTVLMQVEGNPRDQGVFPHFAGFEQSPSGKGWNFLRLNNTSAGVLRMLGTAWNTAGGTLINGSNHTRPAGRFKFATTLEPSVSRMTYVINGGSALVDTSTAGTLATIGSLRFNNTTDTAATDFSSVWVSQFKYWPTVLPNATLQSLTA
jgi:hypothetical protein